MAINALPQLLVALFKQQGAESLPAGKAVAAPFKPGAQYQGKVLESLPNGRNLVRLGAHTLDIALPQQAKPGEVLRLTFVSASPRPTFILAAAAPAVNISQSAQQVQALIRYVPVTAAGPAALTPEGAPANPSASACPLVVNPAVLLTPAPGGPATAALGPAMAAVATAGGPVDGAGATLAAHTSLVAQGVVADQHMASWLPVRLQQTVKESGLFYESHLGRWVQGEMALEAIQREPQARLAQVPAAAAKLPELEHMPEEAARLASRQLNLLEGGPFVWMGPAWPGQLLEWQVRERRDGQAAVIEDGQAWQSRLRLTLPRLGEVAADLDIGAQGLSIRLGAATPASLAEMRAALPELAACLQAAELNLTRLKVALTDGGH